MGKLFNYFIAVLFCFFSGLSFSCEKNSVTEDQKFGGVTLYLPTCLTSGGRITDGESHIVAYPKYVKPNRNVVLFLSGTGGRPEYSGWVLKAGATAGYRVVSLSYKNKNSVFSICKENRDSKDCYDLVRGSYAFGGDIPNGGFVSERDSITGRLKDLFISLRQRDPLMWDDIVSDSGVVNWERITVAGFSLGAGYAAYIGKKLAVNKVVMFSGPSDWDFNRKEFPNWFSNPSATNYRKYYALAHRGDAFSNISGDSSQLLNAQKILIQSEAVDDVTPESNFLSNTRLFLTNSCAGKEPPEIHSCLYSPSFINAWRNIVFSESDR